MYYAEFNTDKYIRETFFPDDNNRIMVEIGAGPPIFYSMSKHFRDSGWRAICVDPNPKFVEQHRVQGNEIYQYACSNESKKSKFTIVNTEWSDDVNGISYSAINLKYPLTGENYSTQEIDIEIITLNQLFANLNISKVDFLSIDVEGWELEVIKGLDINKYDVEIILLENFLKNESYNEYMNASGYTLYNTIHYNYIYRKNK